MKNPGADGVTFINECITLMTQIRDSQMTEISRAAKTCAECIANGGVVHLFASGHSRVSVEEMFPRYGSFPGFHLMIELSLTYHTQVVGANGQRQARFLEDVNGLGSVVLANYELRPPDVMLIFSYSGASAIVVDVALGAKAHNLPVIAVTSVQQSQAVSSTHTSGRNLIEVADIVLDTCSPPGDALVHIDGIDDEVGPSSTITSTIVANSLKCEIAAELSRLGKPPTIFVNRYYGEKRSQEKIAECFDQYRRDLIRALGGTK